MAVVKNVYDDLYNNIKNKFTVEENNCEYTLGGYMLMKANEKKNKNANLAITEIRRESHAVSAVMNYIADKLTVKNPPVKDKTIKAFPFRTSVAAFLSAILVSTVVFTYGLLTINNTDGAEIPVVADASDDENIEDFDKEISKNI